MMKCTDFKSVSLPPRQDACPCLNLAPGKLERTSDWQPEEAGRPVPPPGRVITLVGADESRAYLAAAGAGCSASSA